MRYVIGVATGALLALLLGVPSFSVDDDTETEPPLFSVYCDFLETAMAGRCVPKASGVLLMLSLGAAVGALGAAASHRLRPSADAAVRSAEPQGQAVPSQASPGSGLTGDKDREDVVREAALEIVAAVAEKHADRARDPTIRRKDAWRHISSDLIDRAVKLRIGSPAGWAVDHALQMGWLTSRGTGPEASLALGRTAPPEAAETDTGAATLSDLAASAPEETGQGPQAPSATANEAPRAAPSVLDELENLIRLHERGTITDTELEAARARLFNDDT